MPQDEVSDKEKRLVAAIKRLDPKERDAYRFFVKENQLEIGSDAADKLFDLYCNGSSCDEIRKAVKSYSLGQIVGARVMHDWDVRKEQKRLSMVKVIPDQAPVTLLEAQEFLGDLILATNRRFRESLKEYIATGDEALLPGLPMPKNMKELQTLVELFMKASGQDNEKVVKHIGSVDVKHQVESPTIKQEEDNEATLDELLGLNIVDAEFKEVEHKMITDGKE
jgi:hypothetical protein